LESPRRPFHVYQTLYERTIAESMNKKEKIPTKKKGVACARSPPDWGVVVGWGRLDLHLGAPCPYLPEIWFWRGMGKGSRLMSYALEAFGPEHLYSDKHGALKYSLDLALMDHRLPELAKLISEDPRHTEISGDGGYCLERLNFDDPTLTGPKNAAFRAFVEPSEHELTYPEGYCKRAEFLSYVERAVLAYARVNPARADEVAAVLELIRTKPK